MRKSTVPEVILRARGKTEVEKLVAVVSLGLAEAVRQRTLSTGDACLLFFITAFVRFSETREITPRLVHALHAGSELEDVERLAPRGLGEAFEAIRKNALEVLKELPESTEPLSKKWIERPRSRPSRAP